MNLRLIRPEEVESLWPLAAPRLAPALAVSEGETTLDLLLDRLMDGTDSRLVLVTEDDLVVTAAVLTMVEYPAKRVCQISYAGGSRLDEWCDNGLQAVEKLAKELGADAIYIQGRKGWVRRLQRHGYNERTTLICKDL